LPLRVASHWNAQGDINGWSSRTLLVLLTPLLGVGIALLLAALPRIDPKRENDALHAGPYWLIGNAVLVFLALTQVAIVGANLGWPVPVTRLTMAGVGALFVIVGRMMPRMQPNWFMGIRTPWTLSSETVWRKTHELGGRLMTWAGIAVVLGALLGGAFSVAIVVGAAVVAGAVSLVYSYLLWRREQEERQRARSTTPLR
jgi:uncharacterized membrane protein